MTALLRDEGGQATIIVALSAIVLLGALSFGLDWGYGLTQRRLSQNAADAAAMAAANTLATSMILVDGSLAFSVGQEQLHCWAKGYADANRTSLVPAGTATELTLQYGDAGIPTSWTTSATSTCPASASGTPVPATTIYVRATSGTTYRSLIAGLFGQPQVTTRTSARARLTGITTGDILSIWPMVRHYDARDFDNTGCGGPCAPTTRPPLLFWSASGSVDNMVYGSFKGLVDMSQWSSRFPAASQVEQLIDEWDRSGSVMAGNARKADLSGNCGGSWDTHGSSDPPNNNKQCDIANWFGHSFQGQLSLTERWTSGDLPAGQEMPEGIGSRNNGVCAASNQVDSLLAPSCASGAYNSGDWVETAFGNLGTNIAGLLRAYVAQHGSKDWRSEQLVPGSRTTKYGKAAVIFVYLWDCAETFNNAGAVGDQWDLVMPRAGDCSQIRDGASIPAVDRVHLFTVAPFTFYEGLITTTTIEGFWGGSFQDPRECQADPTECLPLNLFVNSAFLVGDD